MRDSFDRVRLARRSLTAWADYASNNENVSDIVVCLTTTPTRLPFLSTTLASVFAQRVRPRAVEIYLPTWSEREDRAYDVPEWLLTLPFVHVIRCHDAGPATKLLFALKRHDREARLLVIDDDLLLPPTLLAEMSAWSERLPNHVVCGSGWCVPEDLVDRPTTFVSNMLERAPTPICGSRVREPRRVDVMQGAGSYLVKPKFFGSAVHDTSSAPSALRWVDDVWFSGHCNANKVVVPLSRYLFHPLRGRARFEASALGLKNRGTTPATRNNTVAIRHFAHRWANPEDSRASEKRPTDPALDAG